MWLRMVAKSPRCSRQMMPIVTGKQWHEWVDLLDTADQRKRGIAPVMTYLVEKCAVAPDDACSIAIQYVLH